MSGDPKLRLQYTKPDYPKLSSANPPLVEVARAYATMATDLYHRIPKIEARLDEVTGHAMAASGHAAAARELAAEMREIVDGLSTKIDALTKHVIGKAAQVAAKVAEESGAHAAEAAVYRAKLASHQDLEQIVETVTIKREHAELTEVEKNRRAMQRQIIGGVAVALIVAIVMFIAGRVTK